MYQDKYDFIIVGSGAGGATLAKELSGKNKSVLVIEKGIREKTIGSFLDCARYFDVSKLKMPKKSKEGIILWRSLMAGGSTEVSCGNGVRCLEKELSGLGVDIQEELTEAEKETGTVPFNIKRLSSASKKLKEVANKSGYKFVAMPKFIASKKCRSCGKCEYGCRYGAKWTALKFLDEAIANGVDVVYGHEVESVTTQNGAVTGVKIKGMNPILADTVILSAGGFATPILLQHSGLNNAGQKLFMDLFVNTCGIAQGLSQTKEPVMSLVSYDFHDSDGFILSPYIHQYRLVRFLESGMKGLMISADGLTGLMAKTKDDSNGRIFPDGSFSKILTDADKRRLQKGAEISRDLLIKAGVDSKSIVVSNVAGAHPGGTAAIGEVVDTDLQTEINNLFVCDASVLPAAPGAPPILTIIALAKRLAKNLN